MLRGCIAVRAAMFSQVNHQTLKISDIFAISALEFVKSSDHVRTL